jgi:hypothetical protein
VGGLVFSTAEASAELVDLSAKTGISTTRLQELAYVGEQVGWTHSTDVGLDRLRPAEVAQVDAGARVHVDVAGTLEAGVVEALGETT